MVKWCREENWRGCMFEGNGVLGKPADASNAAAGWID